MIKFENTEVVGWEAAIRGMRNPMNSWERSDSEFYDMADYLERLFHKGPGTSESIPAFVIGPNDHDLMMRLAKAGSEHAKYRRMIVVYVDITAPLYWWKEFDTYKVGTVANSCSTMHKIAEKEFTLEDFSCEHLTFFGRNVLESTIRELNNFRNIYITTDDDWTTGTTMISSLGFRNKKDIWWQMIQLLPSSYNQRRTVMMNYEVLAGIHRQRKAHKLSEWREGFIPWIESLPYSEIIIGKEEGITE